MINEIVITSRCEENVINIESDASTMTDNTIASRETKRKRNVSTQMSDLKSHSLLYKKVRKSNILELISDQSIGNKPSSVFKSNLIALKTNKLKSTNFFNTVHPEIHVLDCEYIRSGLDGRSIFGVWKGNQYDGILYKLALNFSPRGSSIEDDAPNFLESIEYVGPYFSKSVVRDICDTKSRNENHVLYVGNCYRQAFIQLSSAVLCSFANSSTIGKQYVCAKELLSCCGSQNEDVFATGSEEGVFIYKNQDFLHHNHNIGRVSSVEFNSDGNVLYCGTKTSGLVILDSRETQWNNCSIQFMDYASGISKTKLFSNQNNMVVSGFDGSLSQIDLRKRGIVLSYPNHSGVNRSPFSFSEHVDILCATGVDKSTRLWSIRTGTHLCTIEPQISSKKIHSCLITDEYRWLVAIFQKNKMYIVEPEA